MGQSSDTTTTSRQANADGPKLSDQLDVDRRLAVLEERTKPKPKSFIEHITQWGGVATFLLALLYTFPLGVWDRFFVSQEEEVRNLIIKLTDADTELFKISQSLPANQTYMISSTLQAKKTALFLPKKPLILKWKGALSAAEDELLAYQAQSIGDVDLANTLYNTALSKAAAEKDLITLADIYRMQASLFSTPGKTDIKKVRDGYTNAVRNYMRAQSNPSWIANTVWYWANFEVAQGSKACGYFLARWSISLMTPAYPQMALEWNQSFEKQQNIDSLMHNTPTTMCEPNEVPFVTEVNLNSVTQPTMFNQTVPQQQAAQPK